MTISAAPLVSMACHCRDCQRLTSGAYSLTMLVPEAGFAVEGETEIGGLHKPEGRHFFCAHCKSWLYSQWAPLQGIVNFRPTMLENASWVAPFVETVVSDKLPGVKTGAKHSYTQFPPPEDFPGLMEEYAREGARPG